MHRGTDRVIAAVICGVSTALLVVSLLLNANAVQLMDAVPALVPVATALQGTVPATVAGTVAGDAAGDTEATGDASAATNDAGPAHDEQAPVPTFSIETAVVRNGVVVSSANDVANNAQVGSPILESSAAAGTLRNHVHGWVVRYATDRMRPVNIVLREPYAFGPWEAGWDPTISVALGDGSLTEWDDHYYVTHNWSAYGQAILELQPGDVVTTNGWTATIEGIYDYPQDAILDEIYTLTGTDATVYQTCIPGEDYIRIAYGH